MKVCTKHDTEQPREIDPNPARRRSTKCIVLIVTVILIAILLPIIIVVASKKNVKEDTLWRDISPITSQLNVTHTLITGAWNDILVIAGVDNNNNNNGVIEFYRHSDDNNDDSWSTSMSPIVTGTDAIIVAMAVSFHGIRIAICVMNPLRFIIYENADNDDQWQQYGETIYATDLLNNNATTTITTTRPMTANPNVILSDDGRIVTISFQSESSSDNDDHGSVHILTDVNSLGGTIGGVWQRMGTTTNIPSDGVIHTAMDGSGHKIVASRNGTMSMYTYNNDDESWQLTAEYDESPLPLSGSLAISRDGSTIAIGSYIGGTVDGSGELYIMNNVWPWYTYNDDKPWLIEGTDGSDYNHQSAGTVQVSLSSKGDYVLVGRQTQYDDDKATTLQVYHFDTSTTEWISLGLPIGHYQQPTTSSSHISLDISDDGTMVTAAILGKVKVYKFVG